MTFNIKQNDTFPDLEGVLTDENGTPINLTDATAVRFHMRDAEGTVVIDADMTVVSPADGTVYYSWQGADTATAGTFEAEVEVTYSTGKIETFPNNTYTEVIITDDIA
ncbi:MAG: BppU family phage baseplate upper protein [Marivita sp.]